MTFLPEEFLIALDADAADEARYHLLATTFDERDDATIDLDKLDADEFPAPPT